MNQQRSPAGLSPRLVDRLQHQIEAWGESVPDAATLTHQVQCYWDEIETASLTKPLVDCDLAGKIQLSLITALQQWDSFPLKDQTWIAAAVMYFVECDDDEHDFDSPIGFDDDAEVVSAVMLMIDRKDLVIP